MQYNQPFDQPNAPFAAFVNGNSTTGQQGSIPPAAQMEYPQREIVNAAAAAGLTPSNNDLTQLAQAMSIGLWLGAMSGSANALTDTLPVLTTTSDGVSAFAIPSLVVGMTFHGIIPATNTGPATLALTGFGTAPGAKPIVKKDGTPLQAGDLPAGAIVTWRWDGTAYRVTGVVQSDITALIGTQTRINAPGAVTIYVRTDGSDSNLGGQTNSAASAFATIQAAYNYLTKSFNPGFTAQIVFGIPGTYAGFVASNNGVTGSISIIGDTSASQANQTSYIITPVTFSTGYVCVLSTIQTITLDGVTLDASNLTNSQTVQVARAGGQGTLALGRVTLRYSGSNANLSMVTADVGSSVNLTNNLTVVGGTIASVFTGLGNIQVTLPSGVTMTMSNVTFSQFANVAGGITNLNLLSFSGSGNSGLRYNVTNNGVLIPPGGTNVAAIPGSGGFVTPGAGYVPGDLGQQWTSFNPGIGATSGTLGTASAGGRYTRIGKTVFCLVTLSVTNVGGASGFLQFSVPFVPYTNFACNGSEISNTGKAVSGRLASGSVVNVANYDNSSTVVAGTLYVLSFSYETSN